MIELVDREESSRPIERRPLDYKNFPALESFECSYSLNWAYGLTYHITSRGCGWFWWITMDAIQRKGINGEKTMDGCYRNPDTGMPFDTPQDAYEHMVHHSADPKTYRDAYMADKLLTVDDAATLLGVTRKRVYDLLKNGTLEKDNSLMGEFFGEGYKSPTLITYESVKRRLDNPGMRGRPAKRSNHDA